MTNSLRHVLPPTVSTTRFLPQMLALAYWSSMAYSVRQVAATALTGSPLSGSSRVVCIVSTICRSVVFETAATITSRRIVSSSSVAPDEATLARETLLNSGGRGLNAPNGPRCLVSAARRLHVEVRLQSPRTRPMR